METVGKFLDSANKVGQFIMWVVGLVTGLVLGIRKYIQKRRQRAGQTTGAEETAIALTTLDEEGSARTIQFRVDSWEAEKRRIEHVEGLLERQQVQIRELKTRLDTEFRVLRNRP